MTNRITTANLETLCETINRKSGTAIAPWSKDVNGKMKANIGNYHIDGVYGGWRLVQVASDGGGIRTIIDGYQPKKDLYWAMQAFLRGLPERRAVMDSSPLETLTFAQAVDKLTGWAETAERDQRNCNPGEEEKYRNIARNYRTVLTGLESARDKLESINKTVEEYAQHLADAGDNSNIKDNAPALLDALTFADSHLAIIRNILKEE